jgi:hypothetical protein
VAFKIAMFIGLKTTKIMQRLRRLQIVGAYTYHHVLPTHRAVSPVSYPVAGLPPHQSFDILGTAITALWLPLLSAGSNYFALLSSCRCIASRRSVAPQLVSPTIER